MKRVEKIKVICQVCGKEEYVTPCRAKKYVCCSKECASKLVSQKLSKKVECTCPICGKVFYLKPYYYNRAETHCCSCACAYKLKETTLIGENNPQFGLKGHLNASFKEEDLPKRNGHQTDIFVYDINCPDAKLNKYSTGRVKKHRKIIYDNKTLFDKSIFTDDGIIKDIINVHHIDSIHEHNEIENLIPLTRKQHKTVHNFLGNYATQIISNIIGVVKQGELLETPEADNQQPSLYGNILEGSETNGRVQLDSNADTSALLQQIIKLLNDYIVQTRTITKNAYEASIKEILESEIKSSELNT